MNDQHFMTIALEKAKIALSKGEFPVGCVIVSDNRTIATGARICSFGEKINEIDHAEMVALRQLAEAEPALKKGRLTLFCTMEPCLMCYGAIILSGISRIVYAYEDVMGGGTRCDLKKLSPLYRDARVEIIPDVMRTESLALFKEFFANPENHYWRESVLSKYTLEQPMDTSPGSRRPGQDHLLKR